MTTDRMRFSEAYDPDQYPDDRPTRRELEAEEADFREAWGAVSEELDRMALWEDENGWWEMADLEAIGYYDEVPEVVDDDGEVRNRFGFTEDEWRILQGS